MGDYVRQGLHEALNAESVEECATALASISDRLSLFSDVVPGAVRGERSAVVLLVRYWSALVEDVISSAEEDSPRVAQNTDRLFRVLNSWTGRNDELFQYLVHVVVDMPFSPVVTQYGPGLGAGIRAIQALREQLPGSRPLLPGISPGWPIYPEGMNISRFWRLAEESIAETQPPLRRVRELFNLNSGELADLFGVTRQAVEQWDRNGEVPVARREKLANLLSVGELLERKLRPGRLPLVAQRHADAYGGLTLLEMVKTDRDRELLELTERSFDWSGAA